VGISPALIHKAWFGLENSLNPPVLSRETAGQAGRRALERQRQRHGASGPERTIGRPAGPC